MQRRLVLSDSQDSFAQNPKDSQKSSISLKQWLHSFKPHNSFHLREHVLKFFISEGLFDVAKAFAEEAGLEMPKVDENAIKKRYELRKHIQNGSIDEAIQTIKEIKSDFQEEEEGAKLLFCLKCLKVIEFIKKNQIEKGINTAKEELLPYSQKSKDYIEHIQRVMSLIAFVNLKESPHYELTTQKYKNQLASSVNEKLLTKSDPDRILEETLILTKWMEKLLEKYVNFPHINFGEGKMFLA